MAALNFPNSPSLNDTHTENGVTFKWNGAAWDRLGDIGAQGSAGAAGAQGAAGPVAGSSSQVVYKDGSNNPAGSANLTFDGTNLSVGGNVSIGGTLTYEDITNIDSVGIITARLGIKIPDSQKIFLGDDSDLQIYHDGANSHVSDQGTGDLRLSGNVVKFNNQSNTATMVKATQGGSVELNYDNSKKLETTSDGIDVNGTIQSSGSSFSGLLKLGEGSSFRGEVSYSYNGGNDKELKLNSHGSGGVITLRTNGTERLRIRSDGRVTIGAQVINTNSMLSIHRDSSDESQIRFTNTTTGEGGNNGLLVGIDSNEHGRIFNQENTPLRFGTNNSERLRIRAQGPHLLIGTGGDTTYNEITESSSNAGLVIGSSSMGNGGIVIRNSTSGTGRIYFADNSGSDPGRQRGQINYYHNGDYMMFATAGSERLRITSDGRIGINETSPSHVLDVKSQAAGTYFINGQNHNGNNIFQVYESSDGDGNHGMIYLNNGSGTTLTKISTNGSSYFNGGNIGIGIANPTNRLHVYSSSDTGEIRLGGGNGSGNHRLFFQAHPSNAYIDSFGNNTHSPLAINASPLNLNVSGGGHVTFGTTTDNPGDGNTTTGSAIRSNGKYFFSCSNDGGHINRNNAGYVLHSRYNGAHKGGVYVHANATSFQTSSDYRLKENIVDLSGAITRIKQLTPRRFNFISEPGTTVDGFIAHEAAPVVPEAVTGTHNEVDADGNPVYQGIDHARLVPLLTAALQEAIAKIETLEAAVATLQGS